MAVAASGQGGVLVRVDPVQSDRLADTTNARIAVMPGRPMKGWHPGGTGGPPDPAAVGEVGNPRDHVCPIVAGEVVPPRHPTPAECRTGTDQLPGLTDMAGPRLRSMDYRHLGRTGLRVSPLCLGTMNFGSQTERDREHRHHGSGAGIGHQLLRHGQRLRREVRPKRSSAGGCHRAGVDGRKWSWPPRCTGDVAGDWPNDSKLSARHIRDACEASLRRLQTDHIDLYQMHHVDRNTPWEEIWQAMDLLVAPGEGDLRGQLQLRRLAHRRRPTRPPARRGSLRPGLRAEPVQPQDPDPSSSKSSRPARPTDSGVLPWSPLGGGLLGGSGRRRPPRVDGPPRE